ncbi:MAG: hypothetical protein SFX74_02190 [Fimbriimonadaceae bacterium]|nr:hypothetical protein [Fimbriimonadaceae bacterium]
MDQVEQELISAYIDGTASAEESARVESLMADPAIRAEVADLTFLRQALRARAAVEVPSEGWQACRARFDEMDRNRQVGSWIQRYAWQLSAVLFAVILVGGYFQRTTVGGTDTEYLARAMASFAPSRQSEQAPAEIRQWVEGVFDSAGRATSPDRLNIEGVEQGNIDGKRVERVWIRDGEGSLILIAMEGTVPLTGMVPDAGGKFSLGTLGKANSIGWHKPGLTVLLVGERSNEALKSAAVRLCQRLQAR